MSNPFAVNMVKLYVPAGMSPSISVAGFDLAADKDGAIEVPKEHVPTLMAHGLTSTPAAKVSANSVRPA